MESKTIRGAMLELLATFFMFDMYPKGVSGGVSGILIFLQHNVLRITEPVGCTFNNIQAYFKLKIT